MSEQHDEKREGEERLARFLAHAGVASRRHAEELIATGHVQVNGTTVTTQGTRIDPSRDRVTVDGRAVQEESRHVYIMLHKPAGYVSTASDPGGRPTVLDLLPDELRQLRVYPVGRLDIDTSGLLLLTNDGDFTLKLAHPRYEQEKHYEALLRGYPDVTALERLRKGVVITEDDGGAHKTAPARVRVLGQEDMNCWLAITLHEGRKRQVRRMMAAVGYHVLQLQRVGVGTLTLRDVPVGRWRHLTDEEVRQLLKENPERNG